MLFGGGGECCSLRGGVVPRGERRFTSETVTRSKPSTRAAATATLLTVCRQQTGTVGAGVGCDLPDALHLIGGPARQRVARGGRRAAAAGAGSVQPAAGKEAGGGGTRADLVSLTLYVIRKRCEARLGMRDV